MKLLYPKPWLSIFLLPLRFTDGCFDDRSAIAHLSTPILWIQSHRTSTCRTSSSPPAPPQIAFFHDVFCIIGERSGRFDGLILYMMEFFFLFCPEGPLDFWPGDGNFLLLPSEFKDFQPSLPLRPPFFFVCSPTSTRARNLANELPKRNFFFLESAMRFDTTMQVQKLWLQN